jgi:ribonuclease HII|tara:strand:- start:102 stop:725 length:624 start_codon:yes stop_codon:yes gene_type:complete
MKKVLETHYLENTLEAGIDEAGRGPMFGRLYIGAAILPLDGFEHTLMRDSKKLSARKRLIAFDYIKENAIDYSIHYVSAAEIDMHNILQATLNGMHKALDKLLVAPDYLLVDGSCFNPYEKNEKLIPHKCFTGGDDRYTPIAAGSILAKVAHDKYIEDICKDNPELDERYGLLSNKGYGTQQHISGIKEHGISKWHRKTFGICKQYK